MKRFASLVVTAATLSVCMVGAIPVSAASSSLKAPTSAKYELSGNVDGMADGTLTVELPKDHNADGRHTWSFAGISVSGRSKPLPYDMI